MDKPAQEDFERVRSIIIAVLHRDASALLQLADNELPPLDHLWAEIDYFENDLGLQFADPSTDLLRYSYVVPFESGAGFGVDVPLLADSGVVTDVMAIFNILTTTTPSSVEFRGIKIP